MKTLNYLILFALSVSVFSCKTKTEDPEPSNTTPKMGLTIDGSAWSAQSFSATYRYGVIVVQGKSANGERIILRMKVVAGAETQMYQYAFDDDISTGTYIVKDDEAEFATNKFDAARPKPGTITYTKLDKTAKTISGSFNLAVRRSTDNSEKTIVGTFENLVYDDKLVTVPTKTMTASVDGTAWVANGSVKAVSSTVTKTIEITGTATNGSSIVLALPYKVLEGSHNIAMFGSKTAKFNPTSTTFLQGETGKIIVTSHDVDAKIIKGTFSFITDLSSPQKNITAGDFVATY